MIRSEVSAANRAWVEGLLEGVQEYLVLRDGSNEPPQDERVGEGSDGKRELGPRSEFILSLSKGRDDIVEKHSLFKQEISTKIPPHSVIPAKAGTQSSQNNNPSSPHSVIPVPSLTRDDRGPSPLLHPSRHLQGQAEGTPKFSHFVFGDANHAYAAGEAGLWQAQLKPVVASGDAGAGDAAPAADTKVELTQLGANKITLNGAANTESPIKDKISHLIIYGISKFPAVTVAGDQPADSLNFKIFAATNDLGTEFITNKLAANGTDIDAQGQLYDAAQKLIGGPPAVNTTPNAKPINQPITALAASQTNNNFYAAVADGGLVTRKLYERPTDWETTVRNAMIDGMTNCVQGPGPVALADPDATAALTAVTPVKDPAVPSAALKNYTQAIMDSVDNALFFSGIDTDAALVALNANYATPLFRDAINLRKGGLLDTASLATNAVGRKTPAEILTLIVDKASLTNQLDSTNAGDRKTPILETITDAPADALAAAIQVALGRGVRELIGDQISFQAYKDNTAVKPFLSLDSRRIKVGENDPITDLDIFVSDQGSLARGVCMIQQTGNDLTTKDAAGLFAANPGKIITRAMYDGIDPTNKDALSTQLEKDFINAAGNPEPIVFGKLEQVGIPCAVYSAADPYPATRAMIEGDVEMVWDDQLNRLFVGFSDISLGDDKGFLVNGSGGACSIMVGQQKDINGSQALYFQPIIGPHFQSLLFQKYLTPGAKLPLPITLYKADTAPTAKNTDYIAAFYQKHKTEKLTDAKPVDDLHASAKKLRVMHTSTGKDYLLFNGGVAAQKHLASLNSKMYALPLVGSDNVDNAGLIAAAQRPDPTVVATAEKFYKTGLTNIDFKNPVGVVDADPVTGNLTLLQNKVGKSSDVTSYVTAILTDWGNGAPGKGQAASQAIFNVMKNDPAIVSGLATAALQSCYVEDTDIANLGNIPATTNKAATIAFNLLNVGDAAANTSGYNFDDANVNKIQKSQLLERVEVLGLDLATDAAVPPLDRAKTQAPTYDIARYILEAKILAAAAGTPALAWAGVAVAPYAKSFGDLADGDIDIAAGTVDFKGAATPAGGIAGGVAGIEGGLGWGIKNIMDAGNNFHTTKLIPAVATMHADATYGGGSAPAPAFDYVRVGNDPQRLSFDTSEPIQDSWVVGDTVYVALGDKPNADHTKDGGVFASTAIFDASGFVRSWSPWRRVQGHRDPAATVALDHTTSRYWSTTMKEAATVGTPASFDTVRVTQWGRGHQADPATDTRLSTVLDTAFGDIGGVFGLYSFGPETQGFKPRNLNATTLADRQEQFSLTVATGNGRVALIQTGQLDTSVGKDTSGLFVPTTAFSANAPGKNVFVFDANSKSGTLFNGAALSKLGIITCAEVSRLPLQPVASLPSSLGWLFVGGTNGLAVLTRWSDGQGWDTATGLSSLLPGIQRNDFPGGSGWRWMQIKINDTATNTTINPFTNVRKIVSDGSKYLYVMTADAVWRIDMMAPSLTAGANRTLTDYSIFERQAPAAGAVARPDIDETIVLSQENVAHTVATTGDANNPAGNSIFTGNNKQFLDMMIGYRKNAANVDKAATQLIVGTTAGLFYNKAAKQFDDKKITDKDVWSRLSSAFTTFSNKVSTDPLKGSVMRLEFTSSQPGDAMKMALDKTKATPGVAQTYADGNLLVTALDPDSKYLAAYRFNLSANDWIDPTEMVITPFSEPYHVGGDEHGTTPYFYKIGTLNAGDADKMEFTGPLDYFARTINIAGSDTGFADGVYMLPEPLNFERDVATGNYEDIDLGLDVTLPLYFGNIQLEPATGAQVVAGDFGVRVND